MKAVILAAGEGTRLRDITKGEIPKPMVDLGEGPLLEHTVNELIDYGAEEIIINLHFKGDKIREYFGNSWRDTPIHYSEEENLLGTSGALKKIEGQLNDTFILVYGDILTDLDFNKFLDYHTSNDSDVSMMVYKEEKEHLPEASILLTSDKNSVENFIEKPSMETIEKFSDRDLWTNAAVFIMEPEVLDFIPEGFSDFSKDVLPEIIESEKNFYAYPVPEETYWHEIGNPERYRKGVKDVENEVLEFNTG